MRGTETSTLDGGWIVHPNGPASTLLRYPWRNHEVNPSSTSPGSEDEFVLPDRIPSGSYADTAGMEVPLGTVVWVHNRSAASGTALVTTSDASFSSLIAVNKTEAYILCESGWKRLGADQANAQGPSLAGPVIDIVLHRSQNEFNALEWAVANGYDGVDPAIVRVTILAGIAIGSSNPTIKALDFGGDSAVGGINWASGSRGILINHALIGGAPGAGGAGGVGGTGASAGSNGGDGGTAIRTTFDLIAYNEDGTIEAGGGGGGGGNGSAGTAGLHGGGGGGGAGVNVDVGGFVHGGDPGVSATGTVPASPGTTAAGGAYGQGTTVGANVGGRGGAGGNPAAAGSAGRTLNDTGNATTGGAAGAAISRASGATVTFVGGTGIVTGSTIVE